MYRNKKIFLSLCMIFLIEFIFLKKMTVINPDKINEYILFFNQQQSFFKISNYLYFHSFLCVLLYMVINNKEYYLIYKYKSRKDYFLKYKIINIVISVFFYSLILSTSIIIFGLLYFGLNNLILHSFFITIYFGIFYDMLYFIIILIIFNIFIDLNYNEILSFIFLEILLSFNLIFNEKNLTILDIPSQYINLVAIKNTTQLLSNIIYIILFILLLLFLDYIMFSRRDII